VFALVSAAATTRGFGSKEFALIGNFIADVLDSFDDNGQSNEEEKIVFEDVKKLCLKFPIY
jgi:glycine hydroxymethyltransferase